MRFFFYMLLFMCCQSMAWGFEVVNDKTSYENDRFLTLNVGLGMTQFTGTKGVDSANPGFLFQTAIGHRISQYLGADLVYQLATISFNSPDPIAPSNQINTRTGLHKEYLRLKAYYPTVVAQPYLSLGFGGYQFFGTNGETALSFPANMMIPFGAGIQTYVKKDLISFDLDFTYFWFLGENQDGNTLKILGTKEISFNMYSVVGGFTFHFL